MISIIEIFKITYARYSMRWTKWYLCCVRDDCFSVDLHFQESHIDKRYQDSALDTEPITTNECEREQNHLLQYAWHLAYVRMYEFTVGWISVSILLRWHQYATVRACYLTLLNIEPAYNLWWCVLTIIIGERIKWNSVEPINAHDRSRATIHHIARFHKLSSHHCYDHTYATFAEKRTRRDAFQLMRIVPRFLWKISL
jgi:hypothetical protein